MPGQHAILSPSAAERWLSCPASIRMEAQVPPEPESPYAREGTIAHELAYLKASLRFGKMSQKEFKKKRAQWRKEFTEVIDLGETEIEMETHTDSYVALIEERMALYPHSEVLLEQRLDTGVPGCWGTSDTVIFSPQHVEIIDFKYGSGVQVEVVENPQLRLYACGAMDEYADILGDTEVIRVTVHQPRMDHVLTEEITPEVLRKWRTEVVIPVADIALNSDDAPFGPSEDACRWCPASGRCKAQLEAVFQTDFETDPETLGPEDIADVLGKRKMIQDWLNAFEVSALAIMYSEGVSVPGYKVVLSGGQRGVRNAQKFRETLLEAGYSEDEILAPRKPKGIGDTEKLLGKEQFKTLLEDTGIVTKSEGKPSIAPESDKRPSIQPNSEAAKTFNKADEEDLI